MLLELSQELPLLTQALDTQIILRLALPVRERSPKMPRNRNWLQPVVRAEILPLQLTLIQGGQQYSAQLQSRLLILPGPQTALTRMQLLMLLLIRMELLLA